MKVASLSAIANLDLVTFDDFASHLPGIPKHRMMQWVWAHKAPQYFRQGHGEPRWRREEIEAWLNERYSKPKRGSRGARQVSFADKSAEQEAHP